MSDSNEQPDPVGAPERAAEDAAAGARPLVTGPRAAVVVLVVMTLLKGVLFHQVSVVEPGFAIALLMTERDHRLRWVRGALLVFVALALVMVVRGWMRTGDSVAVAAALCSLGGLVGLTFVDDDVRTIAALFAVAMAGQLATSFA